MLEHFDKPSPVLHQSTTWVSLQHGHHLYAHKLLPSSACHKQAPNVAASCPTTATSAVTRCCRSSRSLGGVMYTFDFRWPHEKKSSGVRSGDLGAIRRVCSMRWRYHRINLIQQDFQSRPFSCVVVPHLAPTRHASTVHFLCQDDNDGCHYWLARHLVIIMCRYPSPLILFLKKKGPMIEPFPHFCETLCIDQISKRALLNKVDNPSNLPNFGTMISEIEDTKPNV